MADLLNIGTSALLAYRRALDTTGHNIANVGTAGYTRQRVEMVSRLGGPAGDGYIGSGVQVTTVRRIDDQLIVARQQADSSAYNRLETYATLSARVDAWLSNADTGLSQPLNAFFASVNTLAANPNSDAARLAVLSGGDTLAARFGSLQEQLDGMEQEINTRLRNTVEEINGYAQSVAALNERIQLATGAAGGQPPNDLLDQRERLVGEIASRIGITVVSQDGGALSIFTASGQALVLGKIATPLGTAPDEFNSGRLDITYGSSATRISGQVSGGTLGGLLDARREVLEPARSQLGRMAAGLVESFNAQHAQGMDRDGQLGGDFFVPLQGTALASSANGGSASVALSIGSAAQISGDDYQLRFDGSAWQLSNLRTGASVALSGSGTAADPFTAEGLSIEVSGSASAGDRFLLRPVANAAGELRVAISNPAALAAASPLSTAADLANSGSGSIGAASVLDAADPALLLAVTIEFTGAGTYSVNGSGSFAYTPGGSIDLNGWRVQLSGQPATGDRFTIQAAGANSSDNSNARALAAVGALAILDGGRTSLAQANSSLVARSGLQAQQSALQRDAQATLRAQSDAERESVSGVSLDEEAANLLRFQQAYQAAARVIQVADTVFQTLLDAARR